MKIRKDKKTGRWVSPLLDNVQPGGVAVDLTVVRDEASAAVIDAWFQNVSRR